MKLDPALTFTNIKKQSKFGRSTYSKSKKSRDLEMSKISGNQICCKMDKMGKSCGCPSPSTLRVGERGRGWKKWDVWDFVVRKSASVVPLPSRVVASVAIASALAGVFSAVPGPYVAAAAIVVVTDAAAAVCQEWE